MIITAGSTNKTVDVYFVDDDGGTAPGEPTTGLLFSDIETGGSASYHRQGAARVDFTLVTQTAAGAHTDGGFVLIDDTNMPGLYRLDVPDAAFATGVDYVVIQLVAAAANNTVMRPLLIDLTDVDLRDSVRGGMTALPNAAADAAGGLPISDAGALDLDARLDAAITSRLAPTVASRTLDVTATGAAGIDWANVENPTTALDLSGTDIQLADTATTVTNQVTADMTAISGDTTAADNLEATYDGTGYSDGNAPSTQSQVDNIGSASGGAFNFAATTDNTGGAIKGVTFVGSQTGTFANTEAEDGTLHTIDHSGNAIDIVYSYPVGGARTAVEVMFIGYLNSSNDVINLQAYDFVGADWETRKVITGQNGSTNITEIVTLLGKHTGTGADLGTVLIRLQTTGQTSPQLNTDELLVSAVNQGQSVGYESGKIWIDTANGAAGTESFVNGTADNPVDTLADAITISGNIGLTAFNVSTGSSITLAASAASYSFTGDNWTLAFGGQSIAGSMIQGATVSGIFTNTNAILEDCIINAITGPGITMRRCFFNEVTITNNGTAGWFLNDCRSRVAGPTGVTLDVGSGVGATDINLRDYRGGVTFSNLASGDTVSMDGIFGGITLNGADATVEARGIAKGVTNNLTGSPTVNTDGLLTGVDIAAILADTNELQGDDVPGLIAALNDLSAAQVNAEVDTALADYDGPTNAEMVARTLDAGPLAQLTQNLDNCLTGTASGTPTTTTMVSDIGVTADDQFNGRIVTFDNDTTTASLREQSTDITACTAATNTLTFTALTTAPVSGDTFTIT